MSDTDNCFNCKDGRKVPTIFEGSDVLARCRNPEEAEKAGMEKASSLCNSTMVYVVVKKEKPTCWKEWSD